MIEKSQKTAISYALIAVLLWSTVATAFKLALNQLTPLQLMFYSSAFSWLFLLVCLIKQRQLRAVIPAFKNQPWLYLKLGSINPFLYYLVLFKAYDLLPAQQAQALNYTWAITLSLLAVPMLGQRLRRADILALSLAYFGALIISTKGQFTALNFDSPVGVGLALLSTLLWSLYWIFNTKNKDQPILSLFICFSIGLVLIAILVSWQRAWYLPDTYGIVAAAYVGLFEMGLTFVLWLMAMRSAENTASVSNLIFISPFLSLIFIATLLGEAIHVATLVGLGFIVSGLVCQKLYKK